MIFDDMTPNRMTIRVQPDEGIFLRINTLLPDLEVKTEAVDLDMSYRGKEVPEAYEALLFDALKGVYSRRVRADEVDASWAIWTPMLKYLEDEGITPREYPYGKLKRLSLDEACNNELLCRLNWSSRFGRVCDFVSAKRSRIQDRSI